MKLASFPKFALQFTLVATLILALSGCGGTNLALTQGNWSVSATSSVPANGIFYVGGNLTQSGNNISGTMHVASSLCFDVSQGIAFTGTVKGNKVTLTSASVQGQVLTVTATGSAGALSGTYTKSGGGNCLNSDQGNVAANVIPSISGTWNGPITGSGGSSVTLSIALTQASTASADGTFALTGNLTYTGSSCSVSGTVTGFLAGPYVFSLSGPTVEQDGSAGSVQYAGALLDSTTAPQKMQNGTYDVTGGLCTGDPSDSPTFTKQ